MKVRLLKSRAGVGFSQSRGEIVEVETEEAERMVSSGAAELLKEVKKVERAVPKISKEVTSK